MEFEKSLSKRSAHSGGEASRDDVGFKIQELVQSDLNTISNGHVSSPISRLQKIIEAISEYNAIISQVVSVEPHAALAWAGITTILSILENFFQQDEDAIEGLGNIMFLLIRYQSMQESTLSSDVEDPRFETTQKEKLKAIEDNSVDDGLLCLAEESPALKSTIANVIKKNLSIGTKAPQQQFHHLILQPISDLDAKGLPVRLVVVVDALDECISTDESRELLSLLGPLEGFHHVQLRLLITSRRDPHISDSFADLPPSLYRDSELEKIWLGTDRNKDDITIYLEQRLATIAKKHHVSQDWIDETGISQLRVKADGLFIYAATVCRFLDSEDFSDKDARQERLEYIFGDEGSLKTPQSKVDEIYIKVLSFPYIDDSAPRAKAKLYTRTSRILGIIAVLFEPLSALDLEHLAPLDRESLGNILKRLHSILSVPDDKEASIGLVHLSFRDFILSQERSNQLRPLVDVDEATISRHIFQRCLEIMSSELCQDICKLGKPGTLISEVQDSDIRQHIPQYLRYACRYWADHLSNLDEGGQSEVGLRDDGETILAFLQKNVLFWIEAMSWLREIPTTILVITRLQDLTAILAHKKLSAFIYDTKRFILDNRWIIENAPLQLYASALLFSPQKSIVRSQFHHVIAPWITQEPEVENEWTAALAVLTGHTEQVTRIKFSPVESLFLSISLDKTIRLWDYITGTERFRFESPDYPTCATFSHNGKLVAIGLQNGNIMVIEFSKGETTMIYTDNSIEEIAFLFQSDNTLAAISSGKLQTWNIDKRGENPNCLALLETSGEDGAGVFSQNGAFVLVALPGELQLWNAEEERVETMSIGNREPIRCAAISSNGRIAMIATPNKLTQYELTTGKVIHEAEFHADVWLTTFSGIDEQLVVIGLGWGEIEILNVHTWRIEMYFRQSRKIGDIFVSRDSKFIMAGSLSGDIQVWDMASCARQGQSSWHVPYTLGDRSSSGTGN
ncbi:hypothetical protein SLS62_007721 [Diatrype stigma]|uniref:Uncharacterized protein n=1 Tax=Diatrype stigma TaxID=117547 RepID=A0AAN9UW54_9PEZI